MEHEEEKEVEEWEMTIQERRSELFMSRPGFELGANSL